MCIIGIIRVIFAEFMLEAVSTNSRSVTVRAPSVKCVGVCFSLCAFVFFRYVSLRVCVCAWVDCSFNGGPATWA